MEVAEQKAHYLRLWKNADEILKGPDNPCQIKTKDGMISCTRSRMKNLPPSTTIWCCGQCEHLGPKGCTVKALDCKLSWCYTNHAQIDGLAMQDSPMFGQINKLRIEAAQLKIPMGPWRASFKQVFKGKN